MKDPSDIPPSAKWRTLLPPFDFVITAMRLSGGFIAVASLFPAAMAAFALSQTVMTWLDGEYESVPITIEGQITTPASAFGAFAIIAVAFFAVGTILFMSSSNQSFRRWLKDLTKDTIFTETGQGG